MRTKAEIRLAFRDIAQRHPTINTIRFVFYTEEGGVKAIEDIKQITVKKYMDKIRNGKYPYGSPLDWFATHGCTHDMDIEILVPHEPDEDPFGEYDAVTYTFPDELTYEI